MKSSGASSPGIALATSIARMDCIGSAIIASARSGGMKIAAAPPRSWLSPRARGGRAGPHCRVVEAALPATGRRRRASAGRAARRRPGCRPTPARRGMRAAALRGPSAAIITARRFERLTRVPGQRAEQHSAAGARRGSCEAEHRRRIGGTRPATRPARTEPARSRGAKNACRPRRSGRSGGLGWGVLGPP